MTSLSQVLGGGGRGVGSPPWSQLCDPLGGAASPGLRCHLREQARSALSQLQAYSSQTSTQTQKEAGRPRAGRAGPPGCSLHLSQRRGHRTLGRPGRPAPGGHVPAAADRPPGAGSPPGAQGRPLSPCRSDNLVFIERSLESSPTTFFFNYDKRE